MGSVGLSRLRVRLELVSGLLLDIGLVTALTWDFPTWSEWNFTSGTQRVGTAIILSLIHI